MTAVNFTYNADSTQYVASMGEMITATANFGQASRTVAGNLASVGVAATRMTGNLLASKQAFGSAQQMAAAYEQKLSSIEARSVVAGKSFDRIASQIKGMARELPGGIDMASAQVETLQRMGVTSEKALVPLATQMAKIGAANSELGPQLTASFTQLQRTFDQLNPGSVAKMGDSLTSVASKAGASATGITDFANAIAPLSQTLGMTQTQVLGFSAGFAKSGQEGYLAANVFNRMLSDMERSAWEGTGELQVYADTVGMTSTAFTQLVKSNPSEAVLEVFDAISKGGDKSLRTLEQLGMDAPRTLKTITAVAQSGDLRKNVTQAMAGFGSGDTERGAAAAFGGMNDEMSKSVETMQQLTEAAGRPLLGLLTDLVRKANAVGGAFTSMVNTDVVQKLTAVTLMGAGALGGLSTAAKGVVAFGGAKSLVAALPGGARSQIGSAMMWAGANRGKMLAGSAGVMGAGMMMDNSALGMLGGLGLLASNIAPGGTLGKGLDVARRGASAGLDAFYGMPLAYSAMPWRDVLKGKQIIDPAFSAAGDLAGIRGGRLARMFGGNVQNMQAVYNAAEAALPAGADAAAQKALLSQALKEGALSEGAQLRGGLRAMPKNLAAGAAATLGSIGSTLAPALLPLAGVAGAVGLGAYGFGQYRESQRFQDMAMDRSVSTARDASQQYGVQLKPMFEFTEELKKSTDAVSTWTDAVDISGRRAQLLQQQYNTGTGEPRMVIGKDASEEEVLSMINARALMQDPQMVAQIMDDVARQKGTDYANRIGAQVLAGRNNIVGTLGQTIGQIASDAETGWNAPFNTGYSGREENMEGAGGVADQASAYIQEKFQTQGESGAARAQLEILDEFKKRMEESLKADTYDREMWQKVLTGVVGEDRARQFEESVRLQNGNPLSWGEQTRMWRGGASIGEDAVRSELNTEANKPVTNEQLQTARGLTSGAGKANVVALEAAQRAGLTPYELNDLAINGANSEFKGKLGLGQNPTTDDINRALGAYGMTPQARTQLAAAQEPQNTTRLYQATLSAANANPGGAMRERQEIMRDLVSGKPIDATTRESYLAQLQILDSQLVPMQMSGTMTGTQQRTARGKMARQQYALAIQNPDDQESQQRAQEALQMMQQVEMEEQEYLKARAKQAYEFQKSVGRSWDDYYLGVERANEDFQISIQRAEEDFQISRKRTLEEYNISIERTMEDHRVQLTRMAEDTAAGLLRPFEIMRPVEIWSMGSITQNMQEQLDAVKDQLATLDELRAKGLSQEAIDAAKLMDPANAQKVAGLSGSTKGEIRDLNRLARQANRTGKKVLDEQPTTRRMEEDFEKSLKRGEEDLNRSLRNSEEDFSRSMSRSRADFNKQMARQRADMNKQMSRQLEDFRDMDKEFIGDKQKLMNRINKVMEGGTAKWDPVVGNAMDDITKTSASGWLTMAQDSDAAMKWLERSWKQFALDGSTPSTGPASTMPSKSKTQAPAKKAKVDPSNNSPGAKPALGDDDPTRTSSTSRATSFSGGIGTPARSEPGPKGGKGSDTPVKDAWDGEGNLWQGSKKKWQALHDVISKYGPLDQAGMVPGGNAASKSQSAAAKWLWQSLLADGYTEEQAAGILGNLEQESGFNPLADQPNGPGRGIAQWSEGARWSNLTAWANKQGLDPNKLTTQYQFMRHEMKTGTFTDGRWSDAAFRKLKTVQQATDYFGANYEIFGERGPRDQYAANWYASFAGKVGAGETKTKSTKMSLWDIGDAIFQAGKEAEAAAQAAPAGSPGGNIDFTQYTDVEPGDWHPPLRGRYSFSHHPGTYAGDFNAGENTPVYAISRGRIAYVRLPILGAEANNNESYSYGNSIILDTGKWNARYAHLHADKPYAPGISKGAIVEAGQLLGWTGTTGHSTGYHLHFELSTGYPGQGSGQNPLATLAAHGVRMAKGGVATSAQLAMIGEAGDSEAVIPLNQRGVEKIAESIGRYSVSYEARKARTMSHGTAPTTTSHSSYVTDKSTHFNGPISVRADDPNEMILKLDAEKRRRNLYSTSGSGRR